MLGKTLVLVGLVALCMTIVTAPTVNALPAQTSSAADADPVGAVAIIHCSYDLRNPLAGDLKCD